MRVLAFLFTFLVFVGDALAGTVCIGDRCFSCDGSATCVNGICKCKGVAVEGRGSQVQREPCAGQETVIHANGGGKVATTASVDASVYVSGNSAVCGKAVVSGPARLEGSIVNGSANVSGRTTLENSTVDGSATATNSSISRSTLNGSAKVSNSEVVDSTLNGSVTVEWSKVARSSLNGHTALIRQKIDGEALNK